MTESGLARSKIIILLVLTTLVLPGCAALVIGAGVGAASVAHDRRTLGTQVDDKTATSRLSNTLSKNESLKTTNINVHVFNGIALLVGQTPTEALRTEAQRTAETVKHIRKLHNQIRIGSPISASEATNDVWLESKVKAVLIGDKRIDGLHIEVEVENAEVFLLGLVNSSEAEIAVEIARNVKGVNRVVNAFEETE